MGVSSTTTIVSTSSIIINTVTGNHVIIGLCVRCQQFFMYILPFISTLTLEFTKLIYSYHRKYILEFAHFWAVTLYQVLNSCDYQAYIVLNPTTKNLFCPARQKAKQQQCC
uniref:Uncharacterized protein n=1 Tax=Cacopsylla melanoneura TaxID=428564 RepID=A0A8D9FDW5_9HEMI